MEIPDHNLLQPRICPVHNMSIILYNRLQNNPLCYICLQNLPGMVSAEEFDNQQRQIYDQAKKQLETNQQKLETLRNSLVNYKSSIITSLDKIIQLTLDNIKFIKDSTQNLNGIRQTQQYYSALINDLKDVFENQQRFIQDAKNQVANQIQSFQKKYSDIEKLLAILDNNNGVPQQVSQQLNREQAQQQIANQDLRQNQQNPRSLYIQSQNQIPSQVPRQIPIQQVIQQNEEPLKFEYELLTDLSQRSEIECRVFAFNQNNSILVVAYQNQMIVYDFKNGKNFREVKRLNCKNVQCLYFLKSSTTFISGSKDKQINIWILSQNQDWIGSKILNEHNDAVSCLLMNKNENIMFSGSYDCTLKIWSHSRGSWVCQQTIDTTMQVKNVSINEAEDKLIICQNQSNNSSILILTLQNRQLWIMLQVLDFVCSIERLCFTIGDQFVIQNRDSSCLEIYNYDERKKEFTVVSQLQMQRIADSSQLFPCQFIKQLNILTFKHGEFLNIIKVRENQNYEIIQTIKLGHQNSYGRMTEDGEFLITWGFQQKLLQIRGIKYLS